MGGHFRKRNDSVWNWKERNSTRGQQMTSSQQNHIRKFGELREQRNPGV